MPRSALQTALDIAAEHRARVAALEAENAALKARNAELVEGLRPFADAAAGFDWGASQKRGVPDTFHVLRRLTVGHLRRARALLQGGSDAMRGEAPLFDAGRRALEDTTDDR